MDFSLSLFFAFLSTILEVLVVAHVFYMHCTRPHCTKSIVSSMTWDSCKFSTGLVDAVHFVVVSSLSFAIKWLHIGKRRRKCFYSCSWLKDDSQAKAISENVCVCVSNLECTFELPSEMGTPMVIDGNECNFLYLLPFSAILGAVPISLRQSKCIRQKSERY